MLYFLLLLLPLAGSGQVLPLKNGSVPLVLGPTVPLTKGDAAAGEEVSEAKRGLSTAEIVAQENNLNGQPGQGYYVQAQLGTPGQKINILIDTGSSNFAVAGYAFPDVVRHFTASASSTFRNLHRRVYLPYTQGSWTGQLGSDLAYLDFLPNSTKTFRTEVAVITSASGFFIRGSNWDGIVGLAYSSIARPASHPAVPFFDALVASSKGRIPDIFSVQLCGSSAALLRRYRLAQAGRVDEAIAPSSPVGRTLSHGSFVVGGVDPKLYSGAFLFAPLRKEWYYEVVLTNLVIAGKKVISDCKELNFDKTIVDTGTTDLRLPERVFKSAVAIVKAVVGAKPGTEMINDNFFIGKTMLCVLVGDMRLLNFFPALEFEMRMSDWKVMRLKLSPQQYIRYVGFYGATNRDCFKFGVQSSELGTVLGAVFMEGFYTAFDRANKRLGFANSACSYTGGTSFNSSLSGPFTYTGTRPTSDCAFNTAEGPDHTVIEIVSIVLAVLCLLIFVPILVLLLRSRPKRPQIPQNSPSAPPNPETSPPTPMAPNDDRRYLLER